MIRRPRNSVMVITYNQESLISRALDSILCQKDFVYEIIVSDDCSTDLTWEVILNYEKQFPGIIKPYRNVKNLGIFGNLESAWEKISGDIIYTCAGDDIICDGLFENANELIIKKSINFTNESFILFFDFKTISPGKDEKIFSNALVEKYNPISLKLRNLIYNRTTGVSRAVFDQYYPVNKDIGIYADGLIDIQRHIFSKKSYYSPFIGSIYYSGIGVSSRTSKEDQLKSYIMCLDLYFSVIKDLNKRDVYWINYLKSRMVFELYSQPSNFTKYFVLLLKITEFKYGLGFVIREYKEFLRLVLILIKQLFNFGLFNNLKKTL